MHTLPLRSAALAPILAALLLAPGCGRVPPETAVAEGQAALDAGDWEKAVRMLGIAAKAHPDSADVFFNLGMANLMASHNKAAERAFLRADDLSTDPDDAAALEGLAEARRRRGNFKGAANAFEAAIRKVNYRPYLRAGLAACEMDQGFNGSAKDLLDTALAENPDDPVCLYNAGVLYLDKFPEFEKAVSCLYRSLVSPASRAYPEQCAEAARRFSSLGAIRPEEVENKVDDLMTKAAGAARAGDAEKACALASSAFKLDPSNAGILKRQIAFLRRRGHPGDEEKARGNERLGALLFPGDARFPALDPDAAR